MLNRRNLLKFAAGGGAVALAPWDRLLSGGAPASSPHAAHAGAAGVAAEAANSVPFAHEMPVPPVLAPAERTAAADVYRIRMREVPFEIVRGLTSTVRTYEGRFPGPTIRATRDRPVRVVQTNDLAVDTAVHLHGGHVRSVDDGLPMDVIPPGGERAYHYPNHQRAASLWYHDHAHHLEAENVYHGLHGLYLISDEHERSLPLPAGAYDVPLVIRDARVEEDGTLTYIRPSDCPHMLVNGKERPYFRVAARRYRLRVYNACANRYLRLRLADGSAVTQIASDGGLLREPVERTEITLLGGERVELVVDFSRYSVGDSVVLENAGALDTERPEVLRFDVDRAAPDDSSVPARLADLPQPPTGTAERVFDLATFPTMSINGRTYDPERVDVETRVGASEIWTVNNVDDPVAPPDFHVWHSFHTHQVHFHVVERNGGAPGLADLGLKDTVTVGPGESVRIAMTWGPYAGEYLFHCHQLGHAVDGQMGRVDVLEA